MKEIFKDYEVEQKKTVEYFITNQKLLAFGKDLVTFGNIPKILYKILERILAIKESGSYPLIDIDNNMYKSSKVFKRPNTH